MICAAFTDRAANGPARYRWREAGGLRPKRLERGDLVDVMQRDGGHLYGMEGFGLDWRRTGGATDILYWRPAAGEIGKL